MRLILHNAAPQTALPLLTDTRPARRCEFTFKNTYDPESKLAAYKEARRAAGLDDSTPSSMLPFENAAYAQAAHHERANAQARLRAGLDASPTRSVRPKRPPDGGASPSDAAASARSSGGRPMYEGWS